MRDYPTLIDAVRDLPIQLIIGAGSPWSKFGVDIGQKEDLPSNVLVTSFTPLQMRELYRSATVVVVPVRPSSRSCGISVILEAWAMGRPVIATRTAGLASYINNGTNGLFVSPGDPQELRSRIEYLIDQPEEATSLGNNGYQYVQNIGNIDHYIETIATAAMRVAERSR
jgi:glycosyltransferase involved in cell wall biosynthesis